MLSRTLVAACSLAAGMCLPLAAQTAATPSQPAAPAQSTPAAPAQQSTPPLQLHDLPADPHSPTPAEAEQEREQRAISAATQMAMAQARWGPAMSTPGLSITLNEAGRTKAPDGTTQITYRITGTGFAPSDNLMLVRWPLNSQAHILMGGLKIDAKGTAVCAAPQPAASPAAPAAPSAPKPASGANTSSSPATPAAPPCTNSMKPDQPVEVQTTAAPGEVIRVALIREDRTRGAATSVIPFPIANQDKACRLQIMLGMRDAEMVLVEGTGFPPNQVLKLDATSWGDSHILKTKTDPNGRLLALVLPGVKGHDTGDTTVKFAGIDQPPTLQTPVSTPTTPNPDCAPAVTFHWGKGSYKAE